MIELESYIIIVFIRSSFSFLRDISELVINHSILQELIYNFDQTPLSYVVSGKYTFNLSEQCTNSIRYIYAISV